jgi:hypothetical protein
MITLQDQIPGMPPLFFPAAEEPEFKMAMGRYQEQVARAVYTVNAALEPIDAAAKLHDREPSRRWRAHYDLARGRLLALKVRCDEFNWACAKMKKDPPRFTRKDTNAWRLVPDEEIRYGGDRLASLASQATAILKKVVTDYPNTPWALLAERELKDPLGFRWVETHVRVTPRTNNDTPSEVRKRAKETSPKPPEPPKL